MHWQPCTLVDVAIDGCSGINHNNQSQQMEKMLFRFFPLVIRGQQLHVNMEDIVTVNILQLLKTKRQAGVESFCQNYKLRF